MTSMINRDIYGVQGLMFNMDLSDLQYKTVE